MNKIENIFDIEMEWYEIDNESHDYTSTYEGHKLTIKVNPEFPDVPLYTLIIDKKRIDFDNWPNVWDRLR